MKNIELPNLTQLRFELTDKCNQNCSFCCISKGDTETLELEHIKKTINNAIPLGLKEVSFTGGEPFLKFKELKELISYVKSKGLETGVLTNATLVTDENLNELSGLDWARISIEGLQEINDSMRGKGTYEKVIEGIKKFKKMKVPIKLRSTITRFNFESIDDLVSLAHMLEVDSLEFQPYIFLGDKEKDNTFSLTPKYHMFVSKKLLQLKKDNKSKFNIKLLSGWFEYLHKEFEGEPQPYFCGRTFLYVDVNGNVKTCAPNHKILGNIKQESIDDIFKNSKILNDLRNYDASKYCPDCKQAKNCKPCPSPALNCFDTLNGPAPNCPSWQEKRNSKRYFEDLKLGDVWISPLREPITSEEVQMYMDLTGERNKMHSNGIYAPGYLLFQNMGALAQKVNVRKDAFFNEYSAKLLSPIIINQDRFYLQETVIEKQDKGSKNRGYIVLERRLIKENGEVSVNSKIKVQVEKRPLF
ncbi:MAG: radical SAM protein [Candidatus Nanoarchaeia archaeon]|nr:radical SAM protein [Candidatus Nanoarchaeia archaeon]MDD5588288.1 radical SAM protein [Candidatus Nanoarchaeia archaeon]